MLPLSHPLFEHVKRLHSQKWIAWIKQRNDFVMVEFQSSVTGIGEMFYTGVLVCQILLRNWLPWTLLFGIFDVGECYLWVWWGLFSKVKRKTLQQKGGICGVWPRLTDESHLPSVLEWDLSGQHSTWATQQWVHGGPEKGPSTKKCVWTLAPESPCGEKEEGHCCSWDPEDAVPVNPTG